MSTAFITNSKIFYWLVPPGVGKPISLWLSVMPPFATATRFFTEAPSTWWPIWPRPIEIAPVKNWYQNLSDIICLSSMNLGWKACRTMQRTICLKIVHRRYQTASTIIATQSSRSRLGTILGDVPATSAILDRFLDNAEMIQIKGKSFRLSRQIKHGIVYFTNTGVVHFEVPMTGTFWSARRGNPKIFGIKVQTIFHLSLRQDFRPLLLVVFQNAETSSW